MTQRMWLDRADAVLATTRTATMGTEAVFMHHRNNSLPMLRLLLW